jgi:hypothetical protein
MATPDWCGWLDSIWGPGTDCSGPGAIIAAASNVVIGSNPPYYVQDFLAMQPKWGDPPVVGLTVTLTSGSVTATVNSAAGLAVGNPVAGTGIPDGTFIQAISGVTLTLSNQATVSLSGSPLTCWNAPLIPFAVIQAYLALAAASLQQARWCEEWAVAMSLFISHFLTLWASTDCTGITTAAQAAAQGMASGVTVSKAVGDVSVSYSVLQGLEGWGAWNLTKYGQQLATMARIVGSGPLFLW